MPAGNRTFKPAFFLQRELDCYSTDVMLLSVNHGSTTPFASRAFATITLAILMGAAAGYAQEPAQQTESGVRLQSPVQILTPTGGVDFNPYTAKLANIVKKNWYSGMPLAALQGEKGKATVRFEVLSDGQVEKVVLEASSGDDVLDQAAIKAVRDSSPLEPLPSTFKGTHIELRFFFYYNRRPDENATVLPFDCGSVAPLSPQSAPFDRLELLAFVSSKYDNDYENQVICQRGIDFDPDATLLKIFQIAQVQSELLATVSKLKPRAIGKSSPDRDRAFTALRLALDDVHGGQPAAADVDFKRALEWADDSATLHLAYSEYLLSAKRYSDAETHARRSLELWKENAKAHLELALTLSLQGRDGEAAPEAREALRIVPHEKTALIALGFSLARSGQYAAAVPILREAALGTPEVPLVHKHLGGCLVHTRDFAGAIEELNLFLKTNPNDAEAHYFLGVALRETGKIADAQSQYREAKRIDPGNVLYTTMDDSAGSAEAPLAFSKNSEPRPDDGFLSGNVYSNTFFGFSYEFPKAWVVLNAERGKAFARLGGAMIANGDPVLNDVGEVAARNAYPLLLVAKESTKNISTTVNMIEIQAMDRRFAGDSKTGEDFVKSMAALLQHMGLAVTVVGTPESYAVAGKPFWKVRMDFKVNNAIAHGAQVVTIEKGYVLFFVFSTADASKLDDLIGTMQSLRFTALPK